MRAVEARGAMAARAAERRMVDAIEARLRDELNGVAVTSDGASVTLTGKGLLARWLVDPALRFASRIGK